MSLNFLLLQINDSLFPIGSYTHSFGLESYIQMGLVTDAKSARDYILANLNSQILYNDLLAIKLIYENKEDVEKILEIEAWLNISTSAMELRQAAQKLGSRFIKTISAFKDLAPRERFLQYTSSCTHPTHASAYGAFCAHFEIDYTQALSHYLYAQSSNIVTNCVKTIPLSQHDGQAILFSLHPEFERILKKLEGLGREHFAASSAHNDIKAMQHEELYSRLYMS